MDCRAARERLLEASPTALTGSGESLVARHVRSCAACRSLAVRILEETERLAADMDRLRPRMGEDEAVRLAGTGRFLGPDQGRGDPRFVGGEGAAGRWSRRARIPLAAAAAIIALLLTAGPRVEQPDRIALPAPGTAVSVVETDGLSVEIPEQGRVAVFATSDPSVTVVWFY